MSSEAQAGANRYEIRAIATAEERETLFDNLDLGFHENAPAEERALWSDCLPDDRTVCAWDEGEMVGTNGHFAFQMTVPGGAKVPTAGVTMVTVKATHRRRGILTSMMRRQLDDLHEAGVEPIAILTASEPSIYGRFGYGIGNVSYSVNIPRGTDRLAAVPGSDKFRIRIADPQASYDACNAVCHNLRKISRHAGTTGLAAARA